VIVRAANVATRGLEPQTVKPPYNGAESLGAPACSHPCGGGVGAGVSCLSPLPWTYFGIDMYT